MDNFWNHTIRAFFTWSRIEYSSLKIDLFTVYDAILAGGQTQLKLQ